MIGIDTSFLVALSLREHDAHAAAMRIFREEILGREGSMALTSQVLAEYAQVVTDARRFERPLPMDEALSLCENWWNSLECRPIACDFEATALFLNWMDEFNPGRKRLLDTQLAATLYLGGVRRLVTTDWRDFERYGVFELCRLESPC